MKDKYDVLVIGSGPGGAIAARTAAQAGLSVCIVEKRPAVGTPVRCAEGIGMDALAEFIHPDPAWISAEMAGAEIVAPDGTSMKLSSQMAGSKVGYILERKIFDRELVKQAVAAGADVFMKTRASAPIIEDGYVRGAKLEHNGTEREVRAGVTIAADGVESKFSRWCGIDTTIPLREIMSSAQYLMTNIPIEPDTTVFYLGNTVAPEGYLWVFPKGDGMANVGIGISGRKSGEGHRAIDYLDTFVRAHYPDGKIIESIVAGVSVCRPLESTVADGLIIVGDAARVVDPLTGGGIYNAMFTGKLAGETAAKCLKSGDVSREALMGYDRAWRVSKMGRTIERNYKVKEYLIKQDDEKLNSLIRSVKEIDLAEMSTFNLIRELVRRNPRLLLDFGALKEFLA
jgi:digeranylgeranylglycerophospholipid reductase